MKNLFLYPEDAVVIKVGMSVDFKHRNSNQKAYLKTKLVSTRTAPPHTQKIQDSTSETTGEYLL